MLDLGTLGGTTSNASAINDGGQLVGAAATARHATDAEGTGPHSLKGRLMPSSGHAAVADRTAAAFCPECIAAGS